MKIPSFSIAALTLVLSNYTLFFTKLEGTEIVTEAKAAYYYPIDANFRAIYDNPGIYGVEANIRAWQGFFPWVGLNVFYTTGFSSLHKSTSLLAIPVEAGLKYILSVEHFGMRYTGAHNRRPIGLQWTQYLAPYLGVGAVAGYGSIRNHSKYVSPTQWGWGPGVVAKGGFYAFFHKTVFLDLFVNYTYLKINFTHCPKCLVIRTGDLSGISAGGGFGWRF